MSAYTAPLQEKELSRTALKIRRDIVTMLAQAKSGHSAGALGMVEVFVSLYFSIARIDPDQPDWEDRDYILLSAGHICPVLYATLAERGFFTTEELSTLRKLGSRLQGHPQRHSLPGVEISSGPLGQGLSQAIGIAQALRLDGKKNRVFCVMSDGEQQEGQTWEAYLYAGAHALSNITICIDLNNIQIGGTTDQVLPLGSLAEKIASFGWNVLSVDGHSFEEVHQAFRQAQESSKPTAIICNTVPGKGVSFMENDYSWHGKPPSEEQLAQALLELQ